MKDIAKLSAPLRPNRTIGIVGGGQLGRMLASSAGKLGYRTIVLEPGNDCPAVQFCNQQITAAYDDETALSQLAELCDVVTYEFENVPLQAARFLETRVPLSPCSRALEVAQDRLVEKNFLSENGIQVAPFRDVTSPDDLMKGLAEFGSGVLKTRRFGYDGKGQHVFREGQAQDAAAVWKEFGEAQSGGLVLEALIGFSFEFSLIGARAQDGTVAVFEPSQNTHENGILRRSVVPAIQLKPEQRRQAIDWVSRILNALDYIGVIGVEFFALEDDLMVNEIAPRVHNTGHWTVEACTTSQFDQHIRAIAGLPLGSVDMHCRSCEMVNLLGHEADDVATLLQHPDVQLTLYGKAEAREGRKMGHITRLGSPSNA